MFYRSCRLFVLSLVVAAMAVPPQGFAAISGYVRDADSNPIVGATVTFTNESDATVVYDAVTSATGSYTIDMATGVAESQPGQFALGQNFPNPFNPATTIPFSLDQAAVVSLSVYNISGQKVATLLNSHMPAGAHSAVWHGLSSDGTKVSAGVYLYRLLVDGRALAGKMTLLDGGSGGRGTAASAGAFVSVAKQAAVTWRVTITSDGIETYEEGGIMLADGSTYNFTVSRETSEPVSGRYTMPLNIKQIGQFFDFSTGESVEALSSADNWDVAFENGMMGLGVDLNFGKAARALNTGSTDIASVVLPDDLTEAMFTLEAPWNDTTAVAIDDWFDMPQMGVIVPKEEVYIIASSSEDGIVYHKFQLTGYADGTYSFSFAALPDGETVNASVMNGTDTNWTYYSFTDQAEVLYEPPADSWDLYFGPTYFMMGEMGYTAMGKIIPNNGSGVEVAVASETALADFSAADWEAGLETMYEIPDWYTLSGGMPPTYEYPVQTFLVKTTESLYGAFQVLSYKSGGVTGFPTFDFKYNGEE